MQQTIAVDGVSHVDSTRSPGQGGNFFSQADLGADSETTKVATRHFVKLEMVRQQRGTTARSTTRGQSAHPKIPLKKFSPSGGVSSGILPSRGILKNIFLCRHKTFNPPEGLIPCMPCRGKTYKIPLAFFSISTPAGFNLVENSGGKT